ncbi:hypothetical protein V6N13_031283 [Hibiscus sabdariffa]|uniref:Uncharacterized protein n=2 Tax=Hibiscus sabdariffa TaxID=183260 RepID=A0ABR2CKT3_9ROSI
MPSRPPLRCFRFMRMRQALSRRVLRPRDRVEAVWSKWIAIESKHMGARSWYELRQHSHLHRHPLGHHLASSWSLPQVWLPGGVLDLSCTDPLRVHPGYHLCYLRHHQIDMWRFGVGGFLFV